VTTIWTTDGTAAPAVGCACATVSPSEPARQTAKNNPEM
jgi:hypothetical protein